MLPEAWVVRFGCVADGQWSFTFGRVTREHLDVDWYVWNSEMAVLANALVARGWTDVGQHSAEQQRDLAKGSVEFGIAPLARAGTVEL
ncbi:hypothetical protein AB0N24_20295 [Arthrobacter sp. NPDC093128]|uniref:hypothetical protein n=1 Tax=Arthrobacter sp. NPDC093128 TaxID=3154979 RepID=UPI00342D0F78